MLSTHATHFWFFMALNHHLLGGWEGRLQGCHALLSSLRPAALGPPKEKWFFWSFSERFQKLSSHLWNFPLLGHALFSLQGLYSWMMVMAMDRECSFMPSALGSLHRDNHFMSLINLAFFSFINCSNTLSPNTNTGDSLWLTSLHSKK